MSWWKKTFVGLAAVGVMAMLGGCGGSFDSGGGVVDSNLPDWVLKGGGAFPEDRGKALYGLGSVSGIKNVALARDTAEQRARTKVAQTLKTFVAAVTKDYMKSVIAGDMSDSEEGMVVERVAKTITKTTLVGCEIINSHFDSANNTWYALARLAMDNPAMELRKEIMNVEKTRKLKIEAAKAHAELDKIIENTATEMY